MYASEWVNVMLTDVELPDGQRFEHHVLRMQQVAATVVVDDAARVLLLWRHRFIDDRWGWELPIGIVDPGETADVTAAREVLEETGWRPGPVRHLLSFQPSIGIADTPHEIFLADGAEEVGAPTDITEAQRVEWVPLATVPDLIAKGELRDSPSMIGLLYVFAGLHRSA